MNLLLLLACTGGPADKPDPSTDSDDTGCTPQSWYADGDGDGHGAGEAVDACSAPADHVASAGDCDDADAAVHPGAAEVCNDVDDDCDGVVDPPEELPTLTCYRDQDGDGWGTTAATLEDCACPEGYAEVVGDCDDEDAATSPVATETWYDGVDQDCAGDDDFDANGDGFSSEEEAKEGLDCDDTDAAVHPDAGEVCGNGIDDDCDGLPGACGIVDWMWPVDSHTEVINIDDVYTFSLDSATDDVDGDGANDLLVVRGHSVGSRSGDCDGVEPLAALDLISTDRDDGELIDDRRLARLTASVDCVVGESVTTNVRGTGASDVGGDSFADYFMTVDHHGMGGAPTARVYWADGPLDGEVAADEELHAALPADEHWLTSGQPFVLSEPGEALSLLVHHRGGVTDDEPWTAARVLTEAHFRGEEPVADAASIEGPGGHNLAVGAPADIDGDGVADLPVHASAGDGSVPPVSVVLGPLSGTTVVDDADAWVRDGDSRAPTLGSAAFCPAAGGGQALVSVVRDEVGVDGLILRWEWTGGGELDLESPDARIVDGTHLRLNACDGDLDGDGQPEWLVHYGSRVLVDEEAGEVQLEVLAPPDAGTWERDDLWLGGVLEDPELAPASSGTAAFGHTDLDGDGFDDLVMTGSVESPGYGKQVQRLLLFSGGPTGL